VPCGNKGTCVQPNLCECEPEYERPMCDELKDRMYVYSKSTLKVMGNQNFQFAKSDFFRCIIAFINEFHNKKWLLLDSCKQKIKFISLPSILLGQAARNGSSWNCRQVDICDVISCKGQPVQAVPAQQAMKISIKDYKS
jgi:hypothetical protein